MLSACIPSDSNVSDEFANLPEKTSLCWSFGIPSFFSINSLTSEIACLLLTSIGIVFPSNGFQISVYIPKDVTC